MHAGHNRQRRSRRACEADLQQGAGTLIGLQLKLLGQHLHEHKMRSIRQAFLAVVLAAVVVVAAD